jgi:hypothetical protein
MSQTRLYVIGDKDHGAIFITLHPLRAAMVSSGDIDTYAAAQGTDFDTAFGDIAAAIKKLIITLDGGTAPKDPPGVSAAIGTAIQNGYTVSDADFCFVADLVNVDWTSMRIPFPPLVNFLHHLGMGPDMNPPQALDAALKPNGPPDP